VLEAGRGDAATRVVGERPAHLDAEDPAAVRGGQQRRRAALAAGDVEHAALAVEAQVVAEQDDLPGVRRVLELVVALDDLPGPVPSPTIREGHVLRTPGDSHSDCHCDCTVRRNCHAGVTVV
jgi:hypothetical protein